MLGDGRGGGPVLERGVAGGGAGGVLDLLAALLPPLLGLPLQTHLAAVSLVAHLGTDVTNVSTYRYESRVTWTDLVNF